jgi:hypothetical protein
MSSTIPRYRLVRLIHDNPSHASWVSFLVFLQVLLRSPTGKGAGMPIVARSWRASKYHPSMAVANQEAPVP